MVQCTYIVINIYIYILYLLSSFTFNIIFIIYKVISNHLLLSEPTCIYSYVILLCSPNNCCCYAVFSPFKEVICCWILLFYAFWKLKCLFIYYSILTNSLDKLFLTSAVFIVNTDYKVSFYDLNIWTSFLWLFNSFEMFLICCYI